ncbi:hypothetical protein AA12717_2959 [Gluconacetobacter sacchari DSM 12717]|uniref:Uncharacterized protein n=1 Tax=Gluconacetobacter sacchari DSM 12717 TaxID=1307940 RepID=A0ABQ0PAA2_9PROT|nr:hypothetical protein [Gluconacetobacter sacchari]GBQ28459.1 hypothetical protein AA12717_2959 [Gluconacetobacter sacchari DSM 12717]
MIRRAWLVGLLALAACTAMPERARTALVGQPRSAVLSCMGVPDRQEQWGGIETLTWRQDQPVQGPFDIKGPLSLELSLGGHGTCRATVTIRSGRVASVVYSGPSATLLGRNGACAGLVRGCVHLTEGLQGETR